MERMEKKRSISEISATGNGSQVPVSNASGSFTMTNYNADGLPYDSSHSTKDILDAKQSKNLTTPIVIGEDTKTTIEGAVSALNDVKLEESDLADVAISGAYADLTGSPTIPIVTDTYSGTSSNAMSGKAVKTAIDALDGSVTGSGGASKTVTALSQTNGVVSATFGDISITKSQVSDFPTLGTASSKDVASSGNASTTEVVMGNDTRLSDSRPASNVTDTYSATGTAPVSGKAVASAIGGLDVASVGGSGKYLTTISETDGKISATAATADTTVKSGSSNLVTSGAVYTAIDNLPEPMVFKGSLGTGGTITSLPTNGTASIGDTYKVITAGTYASKAAKVGDTFICLTKTSSANTWELIPSGDEPSGTVTSVGLQNAANGGLSVSGSPITSSGTITVGHSNVVTAGTAKGDDSKTLTFGGTFTVPSVTYDVNGHVTAKGSTTMTMPANPNTDAKVAQTATTTSANYEVLFSATADNTTRTEGARKNSNLKFNPSTGNLQATQLNGVTIGSAPKFTDTTYESKTAASGGTDVSLVTTGEKYTWNNKTSNTGTVTKVTGGTGLNGGVITTTGTLSVKYGTAAGTACQGNDSRLSDSRPASDVYAWAKAATKPSYTASEVNAPEVKTFSTSANDIDDFMSKLSAECLTYAAGHYMLVGMWANVGFFCGSLYKITDTICTGTITLSDNKQTYNFYRDTNSSAVSYKKNCNSLIKQTATLTTDAYGVAWTNFDLTKCIDIQPAKSLGLNTIAEKIKSSLVDYTSGVKFKLTNDTPIASATFSCDFYFLNI